jgi:serine phosphatase RsbU (regulator of sigma subunit)
MITQIKITGLLLLILILIFPKVSAQKPKETNYLKIYHDESRPSKERLKNLAYYIANISESNPDSAIYFNKILRQRIEAENLTQLEGYVYINNGLIESTRGRNYKGVELMEQGIHLLEKSGETPAAEYVNFANRLGTIGQNEKAASYLLKAAGLFSRSGDSVRLAVALINLAGIYFDVQEFDKAKMYIERSARIFKENNHPYQVTALNNLGSLYQQQLDYPNALIQFREALNVHKINGEPKGQALVYGNIAVVHSDLGNYDSSEYYFEKALEIYLKTPDIPDYGHIYNQYGNLRLNQERYREATEFCSKSLQIALEIEDLMDQLYSCECLYDAYFKMKDYKSALDYHLKVTALNDSVRNINNIVDLTKQGYEYQFEQRALSDSLRRVEEQKVITLEKQQAAERRRNATIVIASGGLILLIIIGLLLRGYRLKQKSNKDLEQKNHEIEIQKSRIEEQKLIVEARNKETMDSIIYARRLQNAILPDKSKFEYLPGDSFVLYKPKDIVAGDFYWLETITPSPSEGGGQAGVTILLAAADCTGHGVPGALVSMVCNNALNQAVREHKLITPGKILDKTREIVIAEFQKSDDDVKDGMDISLVALTHVGTDSHMSLQWAGANNPLWILRNGEILETKPDKQPIGKTDFAQPFSTHTFQLQSNDCIYLFTDGYQDQFGGPKGKKFKSHNVQQLLLQIHSLPMSEQHHILMQEFDKWRGDLEQIDDLCMIGFRI